MSNQLSKALIDKLKYYVYIYSDPDTKEIFYVGKGKGNRLYSHLFDTLESEKVKRINAIRERGKEPQIELLVHGIEDEETAFKVEAAAIDLLGKEFLTNKSRGWQSSRYGRIELNKLISVYEKEPAVITEKAILIRINQLFRYDMTPVELYDATRGIWKVGERRNNAELAFSIFDGIVQQVYRVIQWFPAGSTFSTRNDLDGSDRWEFVGKIAEETILNKYIGKSVGYYFSKSSQNPIMYVNT